MAENNKLVPVPLSDLPEITDPSAFWIFGSKTGDNGLIYSGKYLFENLAEYAKKLQLERRLAINFGMASPYVIFIGEAMNIYLIEGYNVGALTINGVSVALDTAVNVIIPAKTIVSFAVTTQLTDATSYLFIYAKATLP